MRKNDNLREIKFTVDFSKYADGSVFVEFGDTRVICTATVEEKVPPFLRNTGTGWISAEYSMIPSSTHQRKIRDAVKGKIDGRTHEIQRLIGRSLRSVIDLKALGERTIWIDCDVIQADGGTRTASISGAFVALALACYKIKSQGVIKKFPINKMVSAVSVGIVESDFILDLEYAQDSIADVDMNVVMTSDNEFVEIQSTGEKRSFSKFEFDNLISLAEKGCLEICNKQKEALGNDIIRCIFDNTDNKVVKEKIIYDNSPYISENGKIDIVIASSNEHKIEEIKRILEKYNINLLSLKDVGLDGIEIEETGDTFEENSMIKAKAVMEMTGKISLADDSGLCVDVLNNDPGVYSARYAGNKATDYDNNKLLKQNLMSVEFDKRTGRYVCVITILFPDGRKGVYKGLCEGKIGFNEIGENGFGYDPLFIPEGLDKTFAQMTKEEKDKISHRSRALKIMSRKLREIL